MANPDEMPGADESVDLAWEQVHLEAAVRRFPRLQDAGLAHHWAGPYEMTPDAHPLIGRLEPLQDAYIVGGFSGHGFMHGAHCWQTAGGANGRRRATTLDLGPLEPSRFFAAGATAREYNVV